MLSRNYKFPYFQRLCENGTIKVLTGTRSVPYLNMCFLNIWNRFITWESIKHTIRSIKRHKWWNDIKKNNSNNNGHKSNLNRLDLNSCSHPSIHPCIYHSLPIFLPVDNFNLFNDNCCCFLFYFSTSSLFNRVSVIVYKKKVQNQRDIPG